MYAAGHIRKIDSLGRITLPADLRKQLNLDVGEMVEFFVKDSYLVARRYEPADIFTGSTTELINYHGKKISKESILEMARIAGLPVYHK